MFVCDCVLSLEVSLQKRSEGPMWQELVLGDRRGEYVMNDEQAALIHERLTHLTSEDLVRPCSLHYTNNSTNKCNRQSLISTANILREKSLCREFGN